MAEPPNDKLRVIVDANVLVAGVIWPRWPYEILQHGVKGDNRLVLTDRIIQEAQESIARLAPGEEVRLRAILIASNYENVPIPSDDDLNTHKTLIRDPKDVHVALAAINASVDCLITNDKDLTERYEANLSLHAQVEVLLPAVFLRDYMGWASEQLEQIRARSWHDFDRE